MISPDPRRTAPAPDLRRKAPLPSQDRAQPGDVLGIEERGRVTELGDTREDEIERVEEAEDELQEKRSSD
jgi:hypothetical protein